MLERSGLELHVNRGDSILDVVRDAGIDVAWSCCQGICGTCETTVIAGEPDHRDSVLSDNERASGKTIIICCSGSKSERLVLDL